MPKVVHVDAETEAWLRSNYLQPITAIAARIGCCTDTARRILTRMGLVLYPGAKYAPARQRPVKKQKRCLRCRHKFNGHRTQFMCADCRGVADKTGYHNYNFKRAHA